jgi:hypothetical protein
MSLSCLSFSLHGYIFFSFSLALSCLFMFVSISLSPFVIMEELFSVVRIALRLSLSLACSTRSKGTLSLTYPSCSILVSLSCFSSTLQIYTSPIQLLHSLSFLLAVFLPETVLYSAWRYCNRLFYVLYSCLLIIQPTICSTLLYSALLCSALLCLLIFQPTIHSALTGDIPTDLPMWCSLSRETPSNYPLYSACRCYNRISAQVLLAIHQPNILCDLLCLAILPLTVTQFTQEQRDKITSPVLSSCMAQMGYNRNSPKEVVYGPVDMGGLGLHDLYVEQGIRQRSRGSPSGAEEQDGPNDAY